MLYMFWDGSNVVEGKLRELSEEQERGGKSEKNFLDKRVYAGWALPSGGIIP